jgi:hypothetical protein
MFEFLDFQSTQLYVIFTFVSAIVATILISLLPISNLLRALFIVFLVIEVYMGIIISDLMTGVPRTRYEVKGAISGYTVYDVGEKKRIAVLLNQVDTLRPLTISIPWTEQNEKELSKAMQSLIENGKPVGMEATGNGRETPHQDQGNSLDSSIASNIKFYDFTESVLPPKIRE